MHSVNVTGPLLGIQHLSPLMPPGSSIVEDGEQLRPWTREQTAARAAAELADGPYVNPGTGLPTRAKRVSMAALVCTKAGRSPRLAYRIHLDRGPAEGRHEGFAETGLDLQPP